jgi:hypothetical protein
MPREYVLPLLVIDECGPRVSELEMTEVGDVDEHRARSVSAERLRRTSATGI